MWYSHHVYDLCGPGLDEFRRIFLCMIAYIKKKLPAKEVFIKELKIFAVILMITSGISLSERLLPVYLSWLGVSTFLAFGYILWDRVRNPSKLLRHIDQHAVEKDPELAHALNIVFSRFDKDGVIKPNIPDPTCPYEKIRQQAPPSPSLN